MKVQRVLLVVSKHFKHNRLTLDVLDEGLCDLNRNLLRQHNSTKRLLKLLLKNSIFVFGFTLTFWTW